MIGKARARSTSEGSSPHTMELSPFTFTLSYVTSPYLSPCPHLHIAIAQPFFDLTNTKATLLWANSPIDLQPAVPGHQPVRKEIVGQRTFRTELAMPLTMAAPQRSSVQIQGRPKGNAKTEKKFNGVHKLAEATTHGLKRESKAPAKNVRQTDHHLGQGGAGTHEAPVFYEDVDDDVETSPTTFSKRRVPSRADFTESGSFESQLHPVVLRHKASVVKNKPVTEDVQPRSNVDTPTSPRRPTSTEAEPVQPLETPSPPPLVPPERIPSPSSWHQTLVNLFTGRKRPQKLPKPTNKTHKRNISDPTSSATPGELTPSQIQDLRHGTSEPATSSPASLPPRLIHRQTILPVQPPDAEHPSRRSGHRVIKPAPGHKHIANGRVVGDASEPAVTQRDFSFPEDTATPPLTLRCGHSASKLLDRDGDMWGKFYAKNPDFGTAPFARRPSTNGTSHNTGRTSEDDPDHGGAASGTFMSERDISRGTCASAYIADSYPFEQRLCW